jgi:tripartite ATP-independent transporter DctP family solute receptor
MKKFSVSLMAILLISALVVSCGGSKEAPASSAAPAASEAKQEPLTLTLGHTNAETDPRQTMVLNFAKLVDQKTGGKVKVEVYAGGTLGNGKDEIEALRMGTQDILVEGYAIMGMFSDMCMDSLPYLYKDYNHFMKCWYESDVGKTWIQYAADIGYTAFAPSYRGFRNVTSVKPLKTAADVAGLKIRTPSSEPFVSTWTNLKAQATPMDLAEVITGLQQKTIEAQENPLMLSYSYGFADVCKYLILTRHSCGADVYMMDSERFKKLPQAYQSALMEAAVESAKEISAVGAKLEEEYIAKFKEKGVEVIEPDKASFNKAFAGFVDKTFPKMSDIVKKIAAVN